MHDVRARRDVEGEVRDGMTTELRLIQGAAYKLPTLTCSPRRGIGRTGGVPHGRVSCKRGSKTGLKKHRAAGGVSDVCLMSGVTAGIRAGVGVSLARARWSAQRGNANSFLEDRLGEEVVTDRRFYGDRVPGACPCVQLLTLLTYFP